MPDSLPTSTKVVVIGGGVVGASVAYHLAKFGWKDVLLLEQNKIAGGTTWHAAGLIGRLRTTNSMTKINKYSAELYAGLEKETGHSVGWKQVGSLIVGRSQDRMTQLRRTAAMAEWFGVEVEMISPQAAQEKWPLLRVDDTLGAAWLPGDGKVIPKELATALAKGAIMHGAQILEDNRVESILSKNGRIEGVQTNRGKIAAEYVVLCGGMWARELGLRAGVNLPLYPVEHHYAVTAAIPGAFDELPVGRDPDLCIYFRGEGNGVMLGAFQAASKPWNVPSIPSDFSFKLLEPDWQRFFDPLRNGVWRIPALGTCTFDRFVNGPESFTPDNNFIMGETPELKNLFVAAGFNSVGIASAGGAGKYLAEWMIEGQATMDLWAVDVRRFGPHSNNRSFLRERVGEVLGLHYQLAWPNREFETARGLRKSPLHERMAAEGASFGVKAGWERPNWFAGPGGNAATEYSFGRQNWFDHQAAEHRAARETVALFEQSAFGKLLVTGRDALPALRRICANYIDVPVGKAVYTAMLNARGGFESDLVVTRTGDQEFYLVTGTAQAARDLNWIESQLLPDEHAAVVDVTESWAVLGLMGPRSRDVLSRLTDADLSNEAFPFATARRIDVGSASVRAIRMTYVGELGWELHVPSSQAVALYDALRNAGRGFDLRMAGHYAINSLRLEKGYRAWGAELSPDDTPLEAGLGFAIDWNHDFIGREALQKQRAAGVKRQLGLFVLEDPTAVAWGSEPIRRNGVTVGYTSSGAYGHTLLATVVMGYVNHNDGVTKEFLSSGRYEINIAGKNFAAKLHLRVPYDPERKRILS
jgi:4-methylaminobutanoate oxidase (formaldehyde-forming)